MAGWRPDTGLGGVPPPGGEQVELPAELLYERTLAERVASVRVILTLANFVVIELDHSLPSGRGLEAHAWAHGATTVFFFYAICFWAGLKRNRISLTGYLRLTPVLDVLCASALIVTTGGYLSPFNLWLAFAVGLSAFSHYRRLPLLTAALGLLAHSLIATVPQARPLDYALLTVRAGYLFGFAVVFSFISSQLVEQARALAAMEDIGRRLGAAVTQHAAARILLTRLTQLLNIAGARLGLADGTCIEDGMPEEGRSPAASWSLQIGAESLGSLVVYRKTPLTRQEEAIARALCDRTASTLLRIRLTERLVAAARAEERLRIADELHDTHLQTLVALDVRAEAASRMVHGDRAEVAAELQVIKQIAQQAGTELRQAFVLPSTLADHPGPTALRKLVYERWPGQAKVDIAPDIALSDGQWRAVEGLVKEGLNNVTRHAVAKRVSLRISCADEGQIVCTLENDGTPLRAQTSFGYGLSRIREVVEEQGGQLSLEPRKSGGALLVARFAKSGWVPCKRPG